MLPEGLSHETFGTFGIRRGPRFAHAYKNERRLVNKKSYGLKKGEHIGMV